MRQHVVVIGGGVVGCATAYYLSREGVDVTLIEGRRVGCGASGYAVGLLNPLTGSGIPGPMESLSAIVSDAPLEWESDIAAARDAMVLIDHLFETADHAPAMQKDS